MGSGVRGPGADASGPSHVAAPVAHAWAVAAATAAVRVPAGNAEADAWTVRGWADVAVGCVALPEPFADERDRDLVGDEPARLEDRLHLQAERRRLGDRRPEDVARRDVRDPVLGADARRLRPFAGALGSQNEQIH